MAKHKGKKARKARKQKLCPCPPSSAQIARKRAAKWCKANMNFKGAGKGAFLKCVSGLVNSWKKQKDEAKKAKKAAQKKAGVKPSADVDLADLGWIG